MSAQLAVICNHDDTRPCPVCLEKHRVLLRVVTPAGLCPPRVVPCPHCTGPIERTPRDQR